MSTVSDDLRDLLRQYVREQCADTATLAGRLEGLKASLDHLLQMVPLQGDAVGETMMRARMAAQLHAELDRLASAHRGRD
jgi:hypothetical protein